MVSIYTILTDCISFQTSIAVTDAAPKKIKINPSNSLSSLSSLSSNMPFAVGMKSRDDSPSQSLADPACDDFKSGDSIPSNLHRDQNWRKEVIPTLILWAGNQDDPFNISKQDICEVLQKIMLFVYPMLKNTASSIHINSAMVSVGSTLNLRPSCLLSPL